MSARSLAEILDRYERIDVLVNNAGIQLSEQRTTSEGLPELIAVNYLAPWLLTSLLRERLVESSPARVVVTASEAHRIGWSADPDTVLTDTSPFGRGGSLREYGRSKLLDVLFTFELARRLEGTGVTANCCCPGIVATGLAGTDNVADRVATTLSRTPLVRRPEQGARVLVRLATDPAFAEKSGRFVSSTPGAGLVPPIPATRDRDLQRRLWERTEELLDHLTIGQNSVASDHFWLGRSDCSARWYGTDVTIVCGRRSNASLSASAVWLWRMFSYHARRRTRG